MISKADNALYFYIESGFLSKLLNKNFNLDGKILYILNISEYSWLPVTRILIARISRLLVQLFQLLTAGLELKVWTLHDNCFIMNKTIPLKQLFSAVRIVIIEGNQFLLLS